MICAKLGHMEPGDELLHCQWNQLAEGDRVVVQRENQPRLSGKVDIVADDGSIFWIWLNNGNGRIAVYGGHETRVWLPEIRNPAREIRKEATKPKERPLAKAAGSYVQAITGSKASGNGITLPKK